MYQSPPPNHRPLPIRRIALGIIGALVALTLLAGVVVLLFYPPA